MSESIYKAKAELFKILGHPARIRILELLSERERTVADLISGIGLEASHISQQLAVLRKAGIIADQRQGNTVTYSLASGDVSVLLADARRVLSGLLAEQIELLRELDDQFPRLDDVNP